MGLPIPPIISGTGKATKLEFCTHILSVDRNKRPLQISRLVDNVYVSILRKCYVKFQPVFPQT